MLHLETDRPLMMVSLLNEGAPKPILNMTPRPKYVIDTMSPPTLCLLFEVADAKGNESLQ